jgi:DNA-binding NtrC family response regulator
MDSAGKSTRILCVDKEPKLALKLSSLFQEQNAKVVLEKSLDRVLERFENDTYDVLIISAAAQGADIASIDLLEIISDKCPATQILFLVHQKDIKLAMSALKAGSYQYAKLPIEDIELKLLIETSLERIPEYAPNFLLKEEVDKTKFEQMVGGSPAMTQVYRQIRQAAVTDMAVLLTGETGTGKDLAAQAIHQLSNRADKPYLPTHLGALPKDLVASELFGYDKGAFTGAVEQYPGAFERADNGTVFLDEISTADEQVQVSLLRLIETKSFNRIGGRKTIEVDVRIIAASNDDLETSVRRGEFREDLFYRLDVFHIMMPPLRERYGDLIMLIEHFLNKYSEAQQKTILGISPECINLLSAYDWPGNVRELKNTIIRSVMMCHGDVLLPEHLPERIRYSNRDDSIIKFSVGQTLADMERKAIIRTLEHTGNNRKRAADILGISRRALYNKIAKHGIVGPPRFKAP